MKDCKKIHPLLSAYWENLLSPAANRRVEAHLKDCPGARKELDGLKKLRGVLLAAPEPKPPHDLHERIMAKIQGRPITLAPRKPFWIFPAGAVAVAAMVTVFLFVQNPDLFTLKNKKAASTAEAPEAKTFSNSPASHAPEAPEAGVPKKTAVSPYASTTGSQSQNSVQSFAHLPAKKKMARAAQKVSGTDLGLEGDIEKKEAAAPAPSSDLALSGQWTENNTQAASPAGSTEQKEPPAAAEQASAAQAPPPADSWSGNMNSSVSGSRELVTDPATFQNYWQTLQPGHSPPAVDFTHQAVIVLMDQERPTTGYSIHISSMEDQPGQLVVHFKVESPAPGAAEQPLFTRPWTLQIIPKPTKPVAFQQD